MKKIFNVTGMTCSACSAHVDKSVRKVNGVREVNVNLLQNRMTVEYDESSTGPDEIIEAVMKGGYGASQVEPPMSGKNNQSGTKVSDKEGKINKKNSDAGSAADETEQMKHKLIWSVLFLVPLLYISMAHMFKLWMPEIFSAHSNSMVLVLTELLLCIPVVFINKRYFTSGFSKLAKAAPNMDSLIAIGVTASLGYSMFGSYLTAWYLGNGQVLRAHEISMNLYFESAAAILTLVTMGKYLESRSKSRTTTAVSKLMELAPENAFVIRDGNELEIPVSDINVGDIVVVRAGQSVPADGRITEGMGTLDESAITGESLPVDREKGDMVIGGTINRSGYFRFEAMKVGSDSTLSKIIELMEEAAGSKAPIAKLADKVSGIFVPVVITIAVLTVIIWLLAGYSAGFALEMGIAVLVVSCPCALGLATPTAIMVGTGKGAENGILIKSGESLETARNIDTVVLDKTGTVTLGRPVVTEVITANGYEMEMLLKTANALEINSEHPIAGAITEYAVQKGIDSSGIVVKGYRAIQGEGLYGEIDGDIIIAGNIKMMNHNNVECTEYSDRTEIFANEGMTLIYFAVNGHLAGIIAVADVIKEHAAEAVRQFEERGIEVIMLTGDNRITAEAIRRKAGISKVIAEVLPQEKEAEIRKLQAKGRKVAMIGDGINDAPALARADAGIAIGAGTDIAIESADIVLMKSDLRDAVTAIKLSTAVVRNIKQNLFWAFFYNVIGIPIAAGVYYIPLGLKMSPMFGAFAMSFSSVFVVSNALRLKFFKTDKWNIIKKRHGREDKQECTEVRYMKKINIEGMMCAHCTGTVEKALKALEGVKVEVSLEDKAAYVESENEISDSVLKATVVEAGYEVTGIEDIGGAQVAGR